MKKKRIGKTLRGMLCGALALSLCAIPAEAFAQIANSSEDAQLKNASQPIAYSESEDAQPEDVLQSAANGESEDTQLENTLQLEAHDVSEPSGEAIIPRDPHVNGDEMSDGEAIDKAEVEALLKANGDINPMWMPTSTYNRVMNFALQYNGWRYVWGGRSPSAGGFDCTGLVLYTYNTVLGTNVDLIYTNCDMLYRNYCSPVAKDQAVPGDLVFFKGTYKNLDYISHVGIYCGGNVMYCAASKIGYFRIDTFKNIRNQPAEYFFGSLRSAQPDPSIGKYSTVYDYSFLKRMNPSLVSSLGNAANAANQFLSRGMHEGWVASPVFDVDYYKQQHADLREAFGNDTAAYYNHFVNWGIHEGRRASAMFDPVFYKANNSDVVNAYGTNNEEYYIHFMKYGIGEGRLAADGFDAKKYRNANSDLQSAFETDTVSYYIHYYQHGKHEGRSGVPSTFNPTTSLRGKNYAAVYDYNDYLNNYPNIRSAYDGDPVQTLWHFIYTGMDNGYVAKQSFDVRSYYNAYPDLRNAFKTNLKSYFNHYMINGIREGRSAQNVPDLSGYRTTQGSKDYATIYDGSYYINAYADLKAAFTKTIGNRGYVDDAALLSHFVNYGMREGRQGASKFSVKSYYNNYPDLRRAFNFNLKSYYEHFLNYGMNEGRNAQSDNGLSDYMSVWAGIHYGRVYDGAYYLNAYNDLKQAFTKAIGSVRLVDDRALLEHFVKWGMNEGRQAHASFNVHAYKSRYQDLREAYGSHTRNYYHHFMFYGYAEGRNAS